MCEEKIVSNEVMVTIYCSAYNHEKYIRKTLEGFVAQKTEFSIEIIVHDDASTDKTADIIREYEEKYPTLFFPIYQHDNKYSKYGYGGIITEYIIPKARGKYLAYCEGDDYWTDECKLQKQVMALEKNDSCYFSSHAVSHINENGELNGYIQGISKGITGIVESDIVIDEEIKTSAFHTSSLVFRIEQYKNYINNTPDFASNNPFEDIRLVLYFGQLGKLYYFSESMSHYRELSIGGATYRLLNSDDVNKIKYYSDYINLFESFDKFTQKKYHGSCFYGIRTYKFQLAIVNKDYRTIFARENKDLYRTYPLQWRQKMLLQSKCPKMYNYIKNKIKKRT